jgi:hypothetical protein
MGAYVQALMEDIVHGRGDALAALDLKVTIARLIATGQLNRDHLTMLRKHLAGYTLGELELECAAAYTYLVQSYALIAEESGYTDESFLQRGVNLFPQYKKILPALRHKTLALGRTFA